MSIAHRRIDDIIWFAIEICRYYYCGSRSENDEISIGKVLDHLYLEKLVGTSLSYPIKINQKSYVGIPTLDYKIGSR